MKLKRPIIFTCLLLILTSLTYIQHEHPGLLTKINRPFQPKEEEDECPTFNASIHRKLYSLSTLDRKYFTIDWGENFRAYNPSIIPHPVRGDAYIVTAFQIQKSEGIIDNKELVCTATFVDRALKCLQTPVPLPIEQITGQCEGGEWLYNLRKGPRDARTFYGPTTPYIVYGSLATRSCLGLYIQDLSALMDGFDAQTISDQVFPTGLELQRPPPYDSIQKNWFLFWDMQEQMYVHYDAYPQRTFAQLSPDGSVGPDLSVHARQHDEECMARYMPTLASENEKIHQATNSLSITLCKRSDAKCHPTDDNTFIISIVHKQTWYDWHAQYYGFVVLFKRNSPFNIHAISQKSLWIHGKEPLSNKTESMVWSGDELKGHAELFYLTSISWKTHGQSYQGYVDDPMFISFGIEDARSAGVDILAIDLLKDLAFCEDALS